MKSLRDFIFILGCNKIKLIKFWILVKQEKFVYQITATIFHVMDIYGVGQVGEEPGRFMMRK